MLIWEGVININVRYLKLNKRRLGIELLILLSFLIFSLISVSLLLKSHTLYKSLDLQFHFRRIIELRESILHGNLLPDFSFNEFNGSAIMLSYPYFNLLPAIVLSFFIKSKITLVYVFLMFNTFLTFIVSFYSSRNYTKLNATAYIFSIIYSLSNVFLAYSVITTDLGIVSSYTFLPLIIFAFLKVLHGKKNWIELSIGMSLIAFSHFLNLIIISAFLLLWLAINWRRLNQTIFFDILKAVGLFILVTGVIWLPLARFYFSNVGNIASPVSLQLYGINLKTFFSGLYGSKNFETLGFFPLIGIFISIFFYRRFSRFEKQMYWLSIGFIILVLFFPWQITSKGFLTFLNHFQFTFRLLIIPQVLLSLIFALIITKHIQSKKRIWLYSLTILVAVSLQLIMGQYTLISRNVNSLPIENYLDQKEKKDDLTKIESYKITKSAQFDRFLDYYYNGDNDYIPKKSESVASYVNNNMGLYDNFQPILVENAGYNQLSFKGNHVMNRISLPIYLYHKENLNVYLNGKQVKWSEDPRGLLTIENVQNQIKDNNTVTLKPATNVSRIIGVLLTLIGIILTIILLII